MKSLPKYLYFILFSTFPFFSISQTAHTETLLVKEPHGMLISVFGTDWLSHNTEVANLLEDCYKNRIVFKEETLTTSDKYQLLSSVPLMTKNNPNVVGANFQNFNPDTFNPFAYNIEFLSDRIQVFRVDGTNWIIVISPITR